MNTTSANGPFVTSNAPRRDWASRSSPNRSLPEILFLSSAAKNLTPRPFAEFILSEAEACPEHSRRGFRVTTLVCQSYAAWFSVLMSQESF